MSLPSWECGLKFKSHRKSPPILIVAPFVGVWIEIQLPLAFLRSQNRRSLRGSVD